MEETKKCSKCGLTLPISQFSWASKKDGKRQSMCKACWSEYQKARYRADPERFRKAVSEHRSDNPELELVTRIKACKKNPSQKNAYHACHRRMDMMRREREAQDTHK